MSYVPTIWQTGDIVTADKLNNIEDGITKGANAFVILLDYQDGFYIMDKTWTEIYEASRTNMVVAIDRSEYETHPYYVSMVTRTVVPGEVQSYSHDVYLVDLTADSLVQNRYIADSADDYPKFED